MEASIRQRLLAVNNEFYERFGGSFSGTRFGPQPGWDRIIHYFPKRGSVLDLGCGNGRLALFLDDHVEKVRYVGLERSGTLLEIAREKTRDLRHVTTEFFEMDLSAAKWRRASGYFDVVTALAVLHHMPGFQSRAAFVYAAGQCMNPKGFLILSNWRFMHSPRMQRKLVPWQAIGLSEDDVEESDYLLDWKKDGCGYRYVHQLDEAEVEALAANAGLEVVMQFVADGREGDLSLYSVLKRV